MMIWKEKPDMFVFDFFDGSSRELINTLAEYFDIDYEQLATFLLKDEATAYSLIEQFKLDLNKPDSKNVQITCRHMTTSNEEDIKSFRKRGVLDLRGMLQEDTPLSSFLEKHGIIVDVDNRIISINEKQYPIQSSSEDCTDCYIGSDLPCTGYSKCELNKQISFLHTKLYFYNATVEFFIHGTLKDMKNYSSISKYPEILLTIGNVLAAYRKSSLFDEKLGNEWQQRNKQCYVLQFNANLQDMETYAPMDYERAYWEEKELYDLAGYEYEDYLLHSIPQNFYDNYYLLKVFCQCFYSESEKYGSLLPGKTVNPGGFKIYKIVDNSLKLLE